MKLFYSVHARERMSLRVISEQEVVEALEKGSFKKQSNGSYMVVYGKVSIVFVVNHEEGTVTVVTVMHEKSFQKTVRRYVRKNNTSYREATKQLKGVV
jgi:Domain of unknown function (DUF4258)